MLNDDIEGNFRRNLLVYCTVILAGNFLQLPVEKLMQKLLGIEPGQLDPVRVFVVQLLVFLYLSHRHYFSKAGRASWANIKAKQNELLREKVRIVATNLVEYSNREQGPWSNDIKQPRHGVLEDFIIQRSINGQASLGPEYKYVTMELVGHLNDWTLIINTKVDARKDPTVPWSAGDPEVFSMGQVHFEYPEFMRNSTSSAALRKAVTMSGEATEIVVLGLVTSATAALFVWKFIQLVL